MDRLARFCVLFTKLLFFIHSVSSDLFSVRIGTETPINVVDTRFLSFTIDPEYLFTSDEKYKSKECMCMASALSPAYIRIAGPSTSRLTFSNSTLGLEPDLEETPIELTFTNKASKLKLEDILRQARKDNKKPLKKRESSLTVTHKQWKKFADWSNQTGFNIVFAVNNQEKLRSGMWDANSALSILSVADRGKIDNVVWQLGYECTNQSIEEYLYDLETLRVMVDTFPQGAAGGWRVVAGDVTPCLDAASKSDFKDFVALSNERLDAILLDGNSSSHELEKLSEKERTRLLRLLSAGDTPLWLSDHHAQNIPQSPLLRAADWMSSLGHSARNGFTVHFRELRENELFEPSLSFYMALLYKNLVGERVLDADFDSNSDRACLFAHCTSLRHKPVPGAVTLYGANMNDEPARFSLKLSRREEGGDIMQFILAMDDSGNIIVNGRAMYYEGDIRPVVKRVRPYKTLLLNLPPKSFGFWVLANTKVNACYDTKTSDYEENHFVRAISVEDDKYKENTIRSKRSNEMNSLDYPDFVDLNEERIATTLKRTQATNDIIKQIDKLNEDLQKAHKLLRRTERISDNGIETPLIRRKRQDIEEENKPKTKTLFKNKIIKKPLFLISKDRKVVKEELLEETKPKVGWVGKLLRFNAKLNETRYLRHEKLKKLRELSTKSKVNKRHLGKLPLHQDNEVIKPGNANIKDNEIDFDENLKKRRRRSILSAKNINTDEDLLENEIDTDTRDKKFIRYGKILHKINEQLEELPAKLQSTLNQDNNINNDGSEDSSGALENQIVLKTKMTEDNASINLIEKNTPGFFRKTFNKAFEIIDDLNTKINTLISALNFVD
ncbi:inactive heparanase-2 [Plutella xylostella]|uniref:inactive heparanase-2 n=1 Tax=Plutella xylostella TaxID=51655 RepID=UPI002032856C|nr:inactive heparanase-2 [Plutella xylostella]